MNAGRYTRLVWFVLAAFATLVLRLFFIQVLDGSYKEHSANNVLRYMVQYPPRGNIYDRNGKLLVQSRESYDLMAIPAEVKAFDTAMLATITERSREEIAKQLLKASQFSRRRASVIVKQMTKEMKLRFEERSFPGFYTAYQPVRYYPAKIAGNFFGDVGEVGEDHLAQDPYYRKGDYIGKSGVELSYEKELRGVKGVKVNVVDVHGRVQGSYRDGMYDTLATPGLSLTTTIDADLQAFAEELMAGKVGSVVAIEPSTGEVLVMASSPTYDPDELVGRQRGNNYMKLLADKRRPLLNRAIQGSYPPGSTFKLINGLIGLQEGVLSPSNVYPCYSGFAYGNRKLGCHNHYSPLNLQQAVQNSCNAYFCYVFRNILENRKYGGKARDGYDVWREYVLSFGYGRTLGSDFVGEKNGNIPASEKYDKTYRNSWNALTVISLAIGQGEILATTFQMANLAATVANRGYYYTPHIAKSIEGRDSLDARFYERHTTMVEPRHFNVIVDGMYDAVHKEGGTARIADVAGLEICGKTGTAQNPHGADHSTFLCFAPRDNPRIALSVYVENGRFGATVAAPVASLLIEKYLTDTITRPYLVDAMKAMHIYHPSNAK